MCQYTVLSTGMTSCCFGLAVVLQWVKSLFFLLEHVQQGAGEDGDGYFGCVQQGWSWCVCSELSSFIQMLLFLHFCYFFNSFYSPFSGTVPDPAGRWFSLRPLIHNCSKMEEKGWRRRRRDREKLLLLPSGYQTSSVNPLLISCWVSCNTCAVLHD